MVGRKAKFERVSIAQFISDGGKEPDYQHIVLPSRATVGSAGYDFLAPCEIVINAGEKLKVATGIRCRLAQGNLLMITPKSGLGCKYCLGLANTVGIIDSDYYNADNQGHIMVWLVNNGNEDLVIPMGKSFVQGIIISHGKAQELPVTNNRKGGFGSTQV